MAELAGGAALAAAEPFRGLNRAVPTTPCTRPLLAAAPGEGDKGRRRPSQARPGKEVHAKPGRWSKRVLIERETRGSRADQKAKRSGEGRAGGRAANAWNVSGIHACMESAGEFGL